MGLNLPIVDVREENSSISFDVWASWDNLHDIFFESHLFLDENMLMTSSGI